MVNNNKEMAFDFHHNLSNANADNTGVTESSQFSRYTQKSSIANSMIGCPGGAAGIDEFYYIVKQ